MSTPLVLATLVASALLLRPALAFTQGNLLVLRVGALDGTSLDESQPSSEDFLQLAFLEEIDVANNTVVPSTRIDLASYNLLLPSWNGQSSVGAIASAGLELSADGMFATFGAYQGASVNDNVEAAPFRVAVRVDAAGAVVVFASVSRSDVANKNAVRTVRSVCSVNGKQAWFLGYPNTICYVDPLLSEPSCTVALNAAYGCQIFKKQLYVTGRELVAKLGTGLPRGDTTPPISKVALSALPLQGTAANLFAGVWVQDDQVVFTCDSTSVSGSNKPGLSRWDSGVRTANPIMKPCSDVVGVKDSNGVVSIFVTVFDLANGPSVLKYNTVSMTVTTVLSPPTIINPRTVMYRGITTVPSNSRSMQPGNLLVFRMGRLDGSGPDLTRSSPSSAAIVSAWVDEVSPIDGTVYGSIDLDSDVTGVQSGGLPCGQEAYVVEEGPNAGTLSFTRDGHVLAQYQCGVKGSRPARVVAAIRPSPRTATAVVVAKTPNEPFPGELFTGACADTIAAGIYMTGWGKNSASQGVVFADGAANYAWRSVAGNIPMAASCGFLYTGTSTQLYVAGNHLGGFFSAPGLPTTSTNFQALDKADHLRRYATDFLFTNNGLSLWIADCYLSVAPTPIGAAGVNLYTRPDLQSAFTFQENFLSFAATGLASGVDANGDTIIYATGIDFVGLSGAGPAYIVAINSRTRAISMIKSSGTSSIQFRGIAIVPVANGLNGAKTITDVTPFTPIPPYSPALLPSPSASPSPSVFAPIVNSVSGLSDSSKGAIAGGVIAAICLLGCAFQFFCRKGAAYAMSRMDDLAHTKAHSHSAHQPSSNFFSGAKEKEPPAAVAVAVGAGAPAPALPMRFKSSFAKERSEKAARRSSAVSDGEGEGGEGRKRRGSGVAK